MRITKDYKIVIPSKVLDAEKYAAKELKAYLEKISPECVLEIINDSVSASTPEIVIGNSNRTCYTETHIEGLYDAFHVYEKNGNIYIFGENARAVIYAVYRLLETLGCRFFSADTESIPSLANIELEDGLDIFEGSPFEYRDIYWGCAFDTTWSLKNRLNGACKNTRDMGRNIPETLGGGLNYAGPYFVHTFSQLIPPDEYFDTHPEYFSKIDGERTAKHLYSQLCMTNPDVISLSAKKACQWLRENPERKMVSISQNDSFVLNSYCQCEECSKIIEREGAPSGALIYFVNAVAEKIEAEFPDVIVDTLAYQYSVKPPKYIKPRKNVCVRLCTGGCGTHPIETCENNASIKGAFDTWSEVCANLYVWDYTTNFAQYLTPYPNLKAIPQNIKFFKNHNVKGLFVQGQFQEAVNGEFGELRSYLLSRLLWNTAADVEREAQEFIDAYYGNAAPYVSEYLKFIHKKGTETHMGCAFSCKEKWDDLIDENELGYLDKLWLDAINACEDEKTRLHTVRSSMCHEWFKFDAKRGIYADAENFERLRENFYKKCREIGIERLSEGVGIPAPQLT
ncbi:MAG: DUF4838 domain-containing protein [Ruminococcaceae bacterium]|nr:DUF4838 domain-containing protein [Oscillospiraceae bacterium]